MVGQSGGGHLEKVEPEGVGPKGWGPEGEGVGARRGGGPKGAGAVNCARLEFSGCCVKPRRPRSRQGFTRQPESPNVHISRVPAFKNTTKIQREDRPERRKNEISGGRGKKRAKFWAVRRRGPSSGGSGPGEGGAAAEGGGVQRRGPKILKTPTKNIEDTHQTS